MEKLYKINSLGENYLINKKGDLYSIARNGREGRFIKRLIFQKKYYYCISIKGKKLNVAIHNLLAEVFIPNPEKKDEVKHIDGNTLNNSLDNLEWITKKERLKNNLNRIVMKQVELNNKLVYVAYDNKKNVIIDDNKGNGFKSYKAAFNRQMFTNYGTILPIQNKKMLVQSWKDSNPKIINSLNSYLNTYKFDLSNGSMGMDEIIEFVELDMNVKIPSNIKKHMNLLK